VQCRVDGERGVGGVGDQPDGAGDGGDAGADSVPVRAGRGGAHVRHHGRDEGRRARGAGEPEPGLHQNLRCNHRRRGHHLRHPDPLPGLVLDHEPRLEPGLHRRPHHQRRRPPRLVRRQPLLRLIPQLGHQPSLQRRPTPASETKKRNHPSLPISHSVHFPCNIPVILT
jgi:hypothetical protein